MTNPIKNTIEALRTNNIKARYFDTSEAAVSELLDEIKLDQKVGIGGSITVKSLNIDQKLIERGNKVFFHWLEETPEKILQTRKNAGSSDIYLTSTNALTENGQLVNIDGVGNRVTSMIFGPQKVIIICGVNKIVKDLDQAMQRIKDNAYMNAKRLKLNTPCAINEKCVDCNSPQRMCNVTTIINKKPGKIDMEVFIINDVLGY